MSDPRKKIISDVITANRWVRIEQVDEDGNYDGCSVAQKTEESLADLIIEALDADPFWEYGVTRRDDLYAEPTEGDHFVTPESLQMNFGPKYRIWRRKSAGDWERMEDVSEASHE